MPATATPASRTMRSELATRALSLAAGVAASLLIMGALSQVRRRPVEAPAAPIEGLREVALAVEAPPPAAPAPETPAEIGTSFLQLEAERTDSSVKLPALPFVAEVVPVPTGLIRLDLAAAEFRPGAIDPEFETRHVFRRDEVDQPCRAVLRVPPLVARFMLQGAKRLRAVFVLIVNRDGSVENIRLEKASSSELYDRACLTALKQWKFTPGIRRGKAVRQLAEQAITIELGGGSPFEAH